MKVLHLSSEKSWRGGERQISFLISSLQKLGIENFVVCRKNSSFEKYCQKNNINFLSVPFLNGFDFYSALKIKNFVSENKIDIIHAHTPKGHDLGLLACNFGMKGKFVVTKRTVFAIKHKNKYVNKNISGLVAISQAVKDLYLHNGVEANKVEVIYSAINLDDYKVDKVDYKVKMGFEDKFCIANTSALTFEKDYETFFKVAKNIITEYPSVEFIIMGEGEDREKLKNLVAELGIKDKIHFLGFVDNPKTILAEMDMFLMTSKSEGLGSSLLDALALGVPVVCTNAGGMKEVIEHKYNGVCVNVGDVISLTQFSLELMKNLDLRKKYIQNGTESIKKFSVDILGEKHLTFYKKLLT